MGLASGGGRLGGRLEGDRGKLSRTPEVPWVVLRQNAGPDAICYGRDGESSRCRWRGHGEAWVGEAEKPGGQSDGQGAAEDGGEQRKRGGGERFEDFWRSD